MSSNPDIIEITSDSSSDESESLGWTNYFPPCATTSSNKKHKKKVVKPIAAYDLQTSPPSNTSELPSYAPSFHSDEEEPLALAMSLPRELERAFEKAMRSMKKIRALENVLPCQKPAKQNLGPPLSKSVECNAGPSERCSQNHAWLQRKGQRGYGVIGLGVFFLSFVVLM